MDVLAWLLDSDPALRWQVMRHLTDASDEDVGAERSRVAEEGWGAELLSLQANDGYWDGGVYRPGWVDESRPYFNAWTGTHFALMLLRIFGADPSSPAVVRSVNLVRDNVAWEPQRGYFHGDAEPCIDGQVLANAAYFAQDPGPLVDWILGQQLEDGGWNCRAVEGAAVGSFHTTICVLEGLLELEMRSGPQPGLVEARRRGEEYLLERRLFRRRSSGEAIDPRFTMLSFPNWWYYDVLRGLDYFRQAADHDGVVPDHRLDDALSLISTKRCEDGRWLLENKHQGAVPFRIDAIREGLPHRWITLRALQALKWAGR